MDGQGLFPKTFAVLEKVLDFRLQQHNLIVSNIANMDTPCFQAVDLHFEDELREALEGTKAGALRATQDRHFRVGRQGVKFVKPRVVLSPGLLLSNDLNTVDMDKEMGKMAKNNLMYNVTAQILGKKFAGMINAIKGGR